MKGWPPPRLPSLAASGLLCAALSGASCTTAWLNAYLAQKAAAEALRPAAPESRPPPIERTRTLVRVWADADYRAQNLKWRDNVDKLLDRASGALGQLGVEFALQSAAPWERRSGTDLTADLGALRSQDAGRDVDLVVGLVSALPAFSSSMHELGMAQVLGKHCVLRGSEDSAEYDAITQSFAMLSAEKKSDLYYQRKRHKELAVFVHEWGHTLGALHSTQTDDFMRPAWSADAATFSALNFDIVRVGLAYPNRQRGDRRPWLEALLPVVQAGASTADAERAELAAGIRESLNLSVADAPSPGPVVTQAPERAVHAVELVDENAAVQCKVLGLQRVDVQAGKDKDAALRHAQASLRQAAAQMGGDRASVMIKEREGKRYLLGTVYRCQ